MKAALVTSFDQPPTYAEVPDPVAHQPGELVVDVVAAGLHPRVRSQANGSHYGSTGELPLVPGIDGVVRDPEGRLRYALLGDTSLGTMAQRTVIETNRSVLLPDDVDPVLLAAAMNPAMSSWVGLRRRIDFQPGSEVLILGANGSAGRVAIQICKQFGASRVIAAGRNAERLAGLEALGADLTTTLDDLAPAADVDVVIDYVWGRPAVEAMTALCAARADRSKPLTWLEIGAVADPVAAIPSAALRSTRLQIVGSGIGSVPGREFVAELPQLAEFLMSGVLDIAVEAVPLRAVESTWGADPDSSKRIVFTP